jgi:hypothetical protein
MKPTCPNCNGPMVPLLTSGVCARDCDKHPLVTVPTEKPVNSDEMIAYLKASLDAGILSIPIGYNITYIEQTQSLVITKKSV